MGSRYCSVAARVCYEDDAEVGAPVMDCPTCGGPVDAFGEPAILPRIPEWELMDTAPKDGQEIDLFADGEVWGRCHYSYGAWWYPGFYEDGVTCSLALPYEPTHWAPCRLPPELVL